MPLYDVMCITTVAASHRHVVNTLRRVHSAVTERGGVVRRIQHLGVRPLAYRMRAHLKWNSTGRYIRFALQASPQALAEVEHRLKVDEEVVRFLSIKKALAPKRAPKQPRWRNDALFPAGELAFHRKYSHLDYFAARELLRRGTITPQQVAANDFSKAPNHAPSAAGHTAAAPAPAAGAGAGAAAQSTAATTGAV